MIQFRLVVQYICPIINVGTASIGRGFRGIDIDAKEFMALRNNLGT